MESLLETPNEYFYDDSITTKENFTRFVYGIPMGDIIRVPGDDSLMVALSILAVVITAVGIYMCYTKERSAIQTRSEKLTNFILSAFTIIMTVGLLFFVGNFLVSGNILRTDNTTPSIFYKSRAVAKSSYC